MMSMRPKAQYGRNGMSLLCQPTSIMFHSRDELTRTVAQGVAPWQYGRQAAFVLITPPGAPIKNQPF